MIHFFSGGGCQQPLLLHINVLICFNAVSSAIAKRLCKRVCFLIKIIRTTVLTLYSCYKFSKLFIKEKLVVFLFVQLKLTSSRTARYWVKLCIEIIVTLNWDQLPFSMHTFFLRSNKIKENAEILRKRIYIFEGSPVAWRVLRYIDGYAI